MAPNLFTRSKDIFMKDFFYNSNLLDYLVLKPLSHITLNWELTWDHNNRKYYEENKSFAKSLNKLILEINTSKPPLKYHDHEDRLAEYVIAHLKWKITKVGSRWEGVDYRVILEQGGFQDVDQMDLLCASAGRIEAAIKYSQYHFDDMEETHRKMLGAILSIILYLRNDIN